MKILTVTLDTLNPDPDNARSHNARNLDTIKASLTEFGQQKPIVVTEDGVVVAGRGLSTDVVQASARAFVDALNRLVRIMESGVDPAQ